MEHQKYPAMLYRDAVLSGDPANQRTVADADAELAALEDGFARWERKADAVAVVPANYDSIASQVGFEQAAAAIPPAEPEPEAEPVRAKGKGRK